MIRRKALHEQVRSRWAKIVAGSILFLVVTGIVNFILFNIQTNGDAWAQWRDSYNTLYQAAFGVKFLLALVVFFLASALAGRTEATKRFRDRARFWMTVNLILALIVIALLKYPSLDTHGADLAATYCGNSSHHAQQWIRKQKNASTCCIRSCRSCDSSLLGPSSSPTSRAR